MKKSLKKSVTGIMSIMTVASVIFGLAAIHTAYAVDLRDPVSMWIDPSMNNFTTAQLHLGDAFNVTVWLNTKNDTTDVAIYGWQVKLTWNATLLNYLNAGVTGATTSEFFAGLTTIPVTPVISEAGDAVTFGEGLLTGSRSGNGSLCWIEFATKMAPNETIPTLSSELNFTGVPEEFTFLVDPDVNTVPMVAYNATFNYSFYVPPADTTPPTIDTPTRSPSGAVSENEAVTVTADITDNVGGSGVKDATLSYTTDNATWTNVTMSNGGSGNSYSGTILGQLNGTSVWYYITANDNAGNNAITLTAPYSYSYNVVPEFTIAVLMVMLTVLAGAMIAFRKKLVRTP